MILNVMSMMMKDDTWTRQWQLVAVLEGEPFAGAFEQIRHQNKTHSTPSPPNKKGAFPHGQFSHLTDHAVTLFQGHLEGFREDIDAGEPGPPRDARNAIDLVQQIEIAWRVGAAFGCPAHRLAGQSPKTPSRAFLRPFYKWVTWSPAV